MAKKEIEKKVLKKGTARFNLVGEAKVSNFTFKIDTESKRSDWLYSSMQLGVNCGDGNVVYAEMMGGYGTERDNVINAHGKKADVDAEGNARKDSKGEIVYIDDFTEKIVVDWDDRFDADILETIGDLSFITVGLEQGETKKNGEVVHYTVYEKFLSAYDAIEYMQQHLEDGMVVNVSGNIKFQEYEERITAKKEINSIALSKATPDKYKATFQQTILVDKDSIGKLDKETNTYPISARVIDYAKVVRDGEELFKGNMPFYFNYEVENTDSAKALLDRVLKVKKDITEIVMEGRIVEGTSLAEISDDDIDPDILILIEAGVIERDAVVGKMASGGKRIRKWILISPAFKNVKVGDATKLQLLKTEGKFTEDDMDVVPFAKTEKEIPFKEEVAEEEEEDEADLDWMSALGDDDEELPFN